MLSIPDMAILGAVALLIFGPEQLPRVARKAGNVMREIQNTSQSFIREMERAADLHDEEAKAKERPYDDAPTVAFPEIELPAPDAEPAAAEPHVHPPVAEKLADPRPAPEASAHGEPAPQIEHPSHL